MIATVNTARLNIDGASVQTIVQVEIKTGIGIHLVGMPDSAVKESILRVATALQALGYRIPGKKVVINVSPTMSRFDTSTSCLDLPIAIGILVASDQIKLKEGFLLDFLTFYGEIGLDGSIRDYGHVGHAVAAAAARHKTELGRIPKLITGESTAMQAALTMNVEPYAFENLSDVIDFLEGKKDGAKNLIWNTELFERTVGYVKQAGWLVKAESNHCCKPV